MPEEIKERLSKTEYDKVGEMLLELIAECPYTPSDLKGKAGGILYDEIGDSKGVFILTDGGIRKKKYVSGTIIAVLNMRISYQSAPKTNPQRINAQEVANNIVDWLCDLENLPDLTNDRKIIKFDASPISAFRYESTKDGYIAYTSNVVMECEMKGV